MSSQRAMLLILHTRASSAYTHAVELSLRKFANFNSPSKLTIGCIKITGYDSTCTVYARLFRLFYGLHKGTYGKGILISRETSLSEVLYSSLLFVRINGSYDLKMKEMENLATCIIYA